MKAKTLSRALRQRRYRAMFGRPTLKPLHRRSPSKPWQCTMVAMHRSRRS